MVKLTQNDGYALDKVIDLDGGTESASILSWITFKTTKDVTLGYTVCTGLCLISVTCEAVASSYSTVKVILFRGRIYVGAKIINKSCISFRNACTGERYYFFF